MGYTTDFEGKFNLDKPLKANHKQYLIDFARSRRMKRDLDGIKEIPDPVREASGLPLNPDYYVASARDGNLGQTDRNGIVSYNDPPDGQPSLWCGWEPNEDGTAIVWDGAEKFYNYIEWLKYLIDNFIKPWGYVLNGEMLWQGEDIGDRGYIYVKDNVVTWEVVI